MQLVTCKIDNGHTRAGVLYGDRVVGLTYPSLLALLRDPDGLEQARAVLEGATRGETEGDYAVEDVDLLPPVPEPPTLRDFYAFEQHVKTARSGRSLAMIPEWYEIPTFYFSNTSELYTHESPIPYPIGSEALDFELEIACIIGREDKDIAPEEASQYIAGYTIMNDWSARDFQSRDMQVGLGPGKGKDFATSLGPWLVTPDELASYQAGTGASERYDLTMLARVNGREISRGNFKDIYYSFPQMIAYASRNARLRVGDVIGSGTVGTGCILELGTQVQPWLQRGDIVELSITGLGTLRNTIV
jgi:fumarylacetoacetate (FAA) hydrolase